jgi:hypothetical protein
MSTKKIYLSSPTKIQDHSDILGRPAYAYEITKRVKTRISSERIYNTDVSIEIPSDFLEEETGDEY